MTLPFPDNPYGFSTNVALAQCHFTIARACGMRSVRRVMNWGNLETAEGVFSPTQLATLDGEVQLAYANGMNFTFVLDQAPSWANTTYSNGCSNISDVKALGFVQWLLNRYNGGVVPGAFIARVETGNEGYSDKGPGTTCQSFQNAVPVLQMVYPWVKANYPDVLIGTPAHFNRQITDIQSTHATFYNGPYGSAKGAFDYGNFHWYGETVDNNGNYTGPDGVQVSGNATFNQEWQVIHAIDRAYNNGSVPISCTETGVPTNSNHTEAQKALFMPAVHLDGYNSGGILTHINIWTIQNNNGYGITQGCGTITYRPAFFTLQSFITGNPQWPVVSPPSGDPLVYARDGKPHNVIFGRDAKTTVYSRS